MEAEYVRERRRRRTVVMLGIILAILAAAAVYYFVTNRPGGGTGEVPQKEIVVAAVEMLENTPIEVADVRVETGTDSPALALAATSPAQVVGQVARVRISAGSPILAGMYGLGTAAGLEIIPQGEELTPDSPLWRAVSVS